MQATNFGNRDDRAERRWLDRPSVGCILVERQVSASPVIVREVRGEDASQVPLAENDDVVQTLAPDRADESLREGILPRAARGAAYTYADPVNWHCRYIGGPPQYVEYQRLATERGIAEGELWAENDGMDWGLLGGWLR